MSNSDDKKKTSQKKPINTKNVLESLKGLGGGTVQSLSKDLLAGMGQDFKSQLGFGKLPNRSGEIRPGESLGMRDVVSGKREAEEKLRNQLAFERQLRAQLEALESKKVQELKIQLNALISEIQQIATITPELDAEVKTAVMQAPENPGVYHVIFFEKLLEFVKNFRKKISSANEWMQATNERAAKKGGNVWGAKYKKHGAKYLLSGEHYLTRSAG